MIPALLGLAGETLSDDERSFFGEAQPAGFILFARNCRDRPQLRTLTDSLREVSGRADVPILVDQEGGRVARLGPPEWPSFPAASRFADLYARAPISAIEAARLDALAIASTLGEVGINTDCMPVLDVRQAGAHDVIGDRALGDEPMQVAAIGRAMLDGLEAGGVCGVIKHIPGHGRAPADSHVELPVVDVGEEELASDLAPFRTLRDSPMAMTAHILYLAWDAEQCASLSPIVIGEVIRREIGFDGLLMSDDLVMEALKGDLGARARAAIEAGCDVVLLGSGQLRNGIEVAQAVGEIGTLARQRLERAMARIAGKRASEDYDTLAAKRDALLAYS